MIFEREDAARAAEEHFDRLTRLAAIAVQGPVSLVSLIDRDRQLTGVDVSERMIALARTRFARAAPTTSTRLFIDEAR